MKKWINSYFFSLFQTSISKILSEVYGDRLSCWRHLFGITNKLTKKTMKNIKHSVIEILVYFCVAKGKKSGSKPAISQLLRMSLNWLLCRNVICLILSHTNQQNNILPYYHVLFTDKNISTDSYCIVKHFLHFLLLEYKTASVK